MPTNQGRWLANAKVVDVEDGRLLAGHNVEIVDGHIRAVSSTLPPRPANVVDVGGRFVLPGLISCHTHLSIVFPMSATDPTENPAATVLRAAKRARDALAAGITTLRCVHEQNRADLWLRQARSRGWADVPRIFGAGQAITTPKGHGAGAAWVEAEGEEDFYRAAIEELEAGADHVKVAINGGLARPGEEISRSEMTDGELDGTVRAARRHGKYVVAHSAASGAIRQALGRGVRCFEHAYELDLATATLLAQQGAYLTPTLVVTRCEPWMKANGFAEANIATARSAADGHLEEHQERNRRRSAAAMRDGPAPGRRCRRAAGDGGGDEAARGGRALSARGPADGDHQPGPADGGGRRDRPGSPGIRADLIVVDDNPLDDLAALGTVRAVFQDGRPVKLAL